LTAWDLAAVDDAEFTGVISAKVARRFRAALGNRVLRPLVVAALWVLFAVLGVGTRLRRRRVECELTTISPAMRPFDVDAIDLLKVDAEGAEWEILQGVEDSDWPHIRQLVLEVHDVDDRVNRMRTFLEEKGYRVTVEQDELELLALSRNYMVYARR